MMTPLPVRHALLPLLAVFLLSALIGVRMPSRVAAQQSSVLWLAGYESGDFSEWTANYGGDIYKRGTGATSVVTGLAHSGTRAAKLTISNADGAHGDHGVLLQRWNESRQASAAYYSAWYYFPQQYRPMYWWNLFQFVANSGSFWQLNVGNRPTGETYFYLNNWINGRNYSQQVANLPVGRWVHVEVFYKQAADNTGRVTVWQDGVQLFDMPNVQTRPSDGSVYWTVNNFTDNISPSSATIYIDDATISTSRTGTSSTPPTPSPTATKPAPSATPTPSNTALPVPINTPAPTNAPAPTVTLPGTFEAENYRAGGEGIGYHDLTLGNRFGAYRNDNVDIETCTDGTGCYDVADLDTGEWLAYDVNVATSGSYVFTSRVATTYSRKTFHIEVDGVNVSGPIAVPVTGGWDTWTNVTSKAVTLTAGKHVLKLVADSNLFNWNWISAVATTTSPTTSPAPSPTTSPAPSPTATKPAPSPTTTTPSPSSIVWSAGHETGNYSEWEADWGGGIYNSGTGQASVTTEVAHSGTRAAKLSVTNADGTNGGQAVRIFRTKESRSGKAYWYSTWYYFPQQYRPANWWNIFQFKSRNATRNDAFWQLNVWNRPTGEMYLYLVNWPNSRNYSQQVANIPVGRWVHLEVFYQQSVPNGAANGRIMVYQDGALLFDVPNIVTSFSDATESANWSINNYTDNISPSTATIFIDDATISTTRLGSK